MTQPKRSNQTDQSGSKGKSSDEKPSVRGKASAAKATASARSGGSRPTPSNDPLGPSVPAGAPLQPPVGIDGGARTDIAGIVIACVGIALLIAVVTPATGVLTQAVSDALHQVLGLGAFILPVCLLAWSVTFFVHVPNLLPARIAIGLAIIFVAVLGFVGILTPNADVDPSLLFNTFVLADRGGYVGNGLAWLLMTLVGRVVGIVVLVGMIVAGLVLIGLNLTEAFSALAARTRQGVAEVRSRSEERKAAKRAQEAWYQQQQQVVSEQPMPSGYAPTALFDPNAPRAAMPSPQPLPPDFGSCPTQVMVPNMPVPTTFLPPDEDPEPLVPAPFGDSSPYAQAAYGRRGFGWSPTPSVIRDDMDQTLDPLSRYSGFGCGNMPMGQEEPEPAQLDPVQPVAEVPEQPVVLRPAGIVPLPADVSLNIDTVAQSKAKVASYSLLRDNAPGVVPVSVPQQQSESPVARIRQNRAARGWWDPLDDWRREDFDPDERNLRGLSHNVPGVLPGAPVFFDEAETSEVCTSQMDEARAGEVEPACEATSRVDEATLLMDPNETTVLPVQPAPSRPVEAEGAASAREPYDAALAYADEGEEPLEDDEPCDLVSADDEEADLPWTAPSAPAAPRASAPVRVAAPAAPVRTGIQSAPKPAGPRPAAAPGEFVLPDPAIMHRSKQGIEKSPEQQAEAAEMAQRLQSTLTEFGVKASVVDWIDGPTCTTYEVLPGEGVRVNKFTNLEEDIARALARVSVRIYAPVPGTSYVGIEVPNTTRQTVAFGDILPCVDGGPLDLAVGLDANGKPLHVDLAKLPHLLIAGSTGSGKSVMMNAIIVSMLMRDTPDDVRLIMVDPKQVELSGYNGIPHLIMPVVSDMRQAAAALAWGVTEMDRRYRLFSTVGVRDLKTFNAQVASGAYEGSEFPIQHLPSIVIIIDELTDLMMVAKKDVEASIVRIAQLGRACGIHLVMATQRPSADVVTGLIKANITNRIAFRVSSGIDSKVILDQTGAEKLLGHGDMLFLQTAWGDKPRRLQGCFLTDDEIAKVVEHLKTQDAGEYNHGMAPLPGTQMVADFSEESPAPSMRGGASGGNDDDPLAVEAARLVVSNQLGSTSMLQRQLKLGYARAGRVMDMLEEMGVVGPANGSKPRDVLVRDLEELEVLLGSYDGEGMGI